MKLSVLEQVPKYKENSIERTFEDLVLLTQNLEDIGYNRLWLAEHHNTDAMLSSTPDILAGYLLSRTNKIRIGSGGVMVMHYGALQLAERFSLLSTLFPNRVDMGLGRAPGGDFLSARALNQNNLLSVDSINQLILDTLGLFRGTLGSNHPYAKLKVTPKSKVLPEFWLLGSSGSSASFAAKYDINYAYAQFFTGYQDKNIMNYYKSVGEEYGNKGKTLSALSVVAADTEERAKELALSVYSFRYSLENGLPINFENPTNYSEDYKEILKHYGEYKSSVIVGTYDFVAESIRKFSHDYNVEEIMLITYISDVEEKIKMYKELYKRLNK